MPRSKSDEKRDAILEAAAEVFAERGLSAPTAAISKAAGVAEGTLFTYFATKDDLVNALYREIKLQLADVLMADFARREDTRGKLQHVWDRYVDWGLSHPGRRKALACLQVSNVLTADSRAVGFAPFAEIQVMAREAAARRLIRDLPLEFIASAMERLAETTIEFMAGDPARTAMYRSAGFEMFWNGIRNPE